MIENKTDELIQKHSFLKNDIDMLQEYRDSNRQKMIQVDCDMEVMKDIKKARVEDKAALDQIIEEFRTDREKNDTTSSNLLTLENYIERYFPLIISRIVNKIVEPLM